MERRAARSRSSMAPQPEGGRECARRRSDSSPATPAAEIKAPTPSRASRYGSSIPSRSSRNIPPPTASAANMNTAPTIRSLVEKMRPRDVVGAYSCSNVSWLTITGARRAPPTNATGANIPKEKKIPPTIIIIPIPAVPIMMV